MSFSSVRLGILGIFLTSVTSVAEPYLTWCQSANLQQQNWCKTAQLFCSTNKPEGYDWCSGKTNGPNWAHYSSFASLCCPAGQVATGDCQPQKQKCVRMSSVVALEPEKLKTYLNDHPKVEEKLDAAIGVPVRDIVELDDVSKAGSVPPLFLPEILRDIIAENGYARYGIQLRCWMLQGNCSVRCYNVGSAFWRRRCIETHQGHYNAWGCPVATQDPVACRPLTPGEIRDFRQNPEALRAFYRGNPANLR